MRKAIGMAANWALYVGLHLVVLWLVGDVLFPLAMLTLGLAIVVVPGVCERKEWWEQSSVK